MISTTSRGATKEHERTEINETPNPAPALKLDACLNAVNNPSLTNSSLIPHP